ncbi:MAG: hypothetical protein AAGD43_11875 [Pseudomonadota bacterium]
MSIYDAWAASWGRSSDFNVAEQFQDISAFNGAGNVNAGDFTIAARQSVGDQGETDGSLAEGSDANVGTQVQNVSAFNGSGNVNGGDFTVGAFQDVGDEGGGSGGTNVATQVQNVSAFNGVGNVNGGDFTIIGEQSAGNYAVGPDGSVNGAGVDVNVDVSDGVNVGVQVQTVSAFNGYGNVNGGDLIGVGDQSVGGDEPPPIEDMGGY